MELVLDVLTRRRLEYATAVAVAQRKQRFAEEFELAHVQRANTIKERRKNHKNYDKYLTLEEYGRIFVINLGTWEAFVFWRVVRARARVIAIIAPRVNVNGQKSTAAN